MVWIAGPLDLTSALGFCHRAGSIPDGDTRGLVMTKLLTTVCTTKYHEALKVSACWELMTYSIGPDHVMPWGEVLSWRNCKLCHSTLGKTIYGGKPAEVTP